MLSISWFNFVLGTIWYFDSRTSFSWEASLVCAGQWVDTVLENMNPTYWKFISSKRPFFFFISPSKEQTRQLTSVEFRCYKLRVQGKVIIIYFRSNFNWYIINSCLLDIFRKCFTFWSTSWVPLGWKIYPGNPAVARSCGNKSNMKFKLSPL